MINTGCLVLAIAYTLLMLLYRIGWKMQRAFQVAESFRPSTTIAVIIPARNEAANIAACLRSIIAQHYPPELLEIIVVDDHSEDDTAALARSVSGAIRVIALQDFLPGDHTNIAYKKKALNAGILLSNAALIVTTDADCIAPRGWLLHIAAMHEQQHSAMIIGPVSFSIRPRLLDVFQSLDFMTMQGITAAAHRLQLGGMANGANLAFTRESFTDIGGYEGIDHIASGDDYLLLHKMRKTFRGRIHYLKSTGAVIKTTPQPTPGTFLQQRIRWASKSGKYSDHRLTLILMLVYLFNATLGALAIFCIWFPVLRAILTEMLLIKIIAELVFLFPVARFFDKRSELWLFPLLQPLHILYIILAGLMGMMGGYRWKGRSVR